MKTYRHTYFSSLAVSAMLIAASQTQAQFTVTYDFDDPGSTANVSADVTGSQASQVTAFDFEHPGAAAISGSSDSGYLFTDDTGSDEAAALADTDYFSFTISAANGGEFLDLTSFTFDFGGRGSSAFTSNVVVQSSVGGFGTGNPTLVATPNEFTIEGINSENETTNTIVDVSGLDFNNLSTVTFQIRFFDNQTSGNLSNRIDNVVVSGTVIPEPETFAMIAGLLCMTYVMVRRRN